MILPFCLGHRAKPAKAAETGNQQLHASPFPGREHSCTPTEPRPHICTSRSPDTDLHLDVLISSASSPEAAQPC